MLQNCWEHQKPKKVYGKKKKKIPNGFFVTFFFFRGILTNSSILQLKWGRVDGNDIYLQKKKV